MLLRTHLVITLFFALLLLGFVDNQISFLVIALIATLVPDIDTKFSRVGKFKFFRIFQIFLEHRGFFHSFCFLGIILMIFYLVYPVAIFPFALGFGLHLIVDSLTYKGITPFYPFGKRFSGSLKTGSRTDDFLFLLFAFASLGFLFLMFHSGVLLRFIQIYL